MLGSFRKKERDLKLKVLEKSMDIEEFLMRSAEIVALAGFSGLTTILTVVIHKKDLGPQFMFNFSNAWFSIWALIFIVVALAAVFPFLIKLQKKKPRRKIPEEFKL